MKKIILKMSKNYLPVLLGLFCFAGTIFAIGNEVLCEKLVQQEELSSNDHRNLKEELKLFFGEDERHLGAEDALSLIACGGNLYAASPDSWTMFLGFGPLRITGREFCTRLYPNPNRAVLWAIWFNDEFLFANAYCHDWVMSEDAPLESEENGLYIGGDITGPAFNPGMLLSGRDNDWSTRCDLITNPTQAETSDYHCETAPPMETWAKEIPGGLGTLAGGFVGYRRGKVRYEGEYFFRHTGHKGFESPVSIGDGKVSLEKMTEETAISEVESDDIVSHNGAFNVYYDFDSIGSSNWKPYMGVGVVLSRVSLDHFARFTRNHNPDNIKTFEDPLLKAGLAGTTTIDNSNFVDTLFGFQALAGLDYELNDGFSIGFKMRWIDMNSFEGSANWLQLRSHEGDSIGRDFEVLHTQTTDGIRALGMNFNMKYQWHRKK